MAKQHIANRILEEPIYATDGILAIRTELMKDKEGKVFGVRVFIQTEGGERQISSTTRVFNDILRAPERELTKEEYYNWKIPF